MTAPAVSKSPHVQVVYVQESDQLAFWCKYCRRTHYHGASSAGERGAHCQSEASPYFRTGIHLEVIGQVAKATSVRGPTSPRHVKPLPADLRMRYDA